MNYADQLKDVFKALLETPVNSFDITSDLKNTIIEVCIQRYVSFSLMAEDSFFHYGINIKEDHISNVFLPYFSVYKNGEWDKRSHRQEIVELFPKYTVQDFVDSSQITEILSSYSYILIKVFVEGSKKQYSFYGVKNSLSASMNQDDPNYIFSEHLNNLNYDDLKVQIGKDAYSLFSPESFINKFSSSFLNDKNVFYIGIKSLDRDILDNSLSTIIANTDDLESLLKFYKDRDTNFRLFRIVSAIRAKYVESFNLLSKKESIKSAISAIMSRNMSHNLGSHYLYYTKAQLDKLSSEVGEWGPKVRGASKVLGYVQARMDYLATVISNDKYPYGAVNFKSQIFDELTVDKFSKRHFDESKKDQRITNYLLANLIKSENFTVPDIIDDNTPDGYSRLDICVKLYNEETKKYDYFSGYDTVQHDETYVKNRLSNLYIALPGGIMSSHALFNVIENFIRNSAKYLQSDFQHYGLVFNILLRPSVDKRFIDLIIYDNKQNANRVLSKDNSTNKTVTLYQSILDKLSTLKIINSANEIEKDSKGFKEMLFSSVWMKAYEFKDRTYADIITEINLEEDRNAKLALIEKYGFSLVQVYDPFRECDDEELSLEDEILKLLSSENSETDCGNTDEEQIVIADLCNLNLISDCADKANLGIKLTLPLFNNTVSFKTIRSTEEGALKKNIESMLAVYSDIICVDEEYYNPVNKISHCFTRAYLGQKTRPVEILREMLGQRFPDFDKYQLVFDNKTEYNSYDISETELSKYDIAGWDNYQKERMSHRIVFRRHLNSKEGIDFNNFSNYAYADTVSGGNFTITINDLITQNLTEYGYVDEESEYFALKVKESALTRITIIDERLFNSMSGREAEYMVKNLRVLNYNKLEDDIANCVGLIDKFLSNDISYDAYKDNLQCELGAIIENIANKLDRNSCYKKWCDELISSLDFDKLSESDSVETNKKYLSDTIVSKICEIADYKISILFDGNRFKDGSDHTHFLSIHLGLIEKILKNSCIVNKIIDSRLHITDESYNRLDQDRVIEFMTMIRELFESTDLYVAIHSGRGNFSKELEGPLASYPFISLSALENAFNNSKYLLSQIFYNTIYIGKGLANN